MKNKKKKKLEAFKNAESVLQRLDFCGCGDTEKFWTALKNLLNIFAIENWEEKMKVQREWENKYGESATLILYFLDALHLTEHGSSIGGSWLSEDGRIILKHLEENGCDDEYWF